MQNYEARWVEYVEALTLRAIVSRTEGQRSFDDGRFRVIRVMASYFGEDGHEYRKSFESKGIEPTVPLYGTHKELNDLTIQYNGGAK